MSARTRTHRPTGTSPRLSRRRGYVTRATDGHLYRQNRLRWDSSALGTFRHADQQAPRRVTDG